MRHGVRGRGAGITDLRSRQPFFAAGPRLFALDPRTGHVRREKYPGGRFGIVHPVIVGNTIYLANSWNWILTEPVSAIVGHHRRTRGVLP